MNGSTDFKSDSSEYVEIDPTGRYGRYNDVLGRGASKTVYRAFDEYEGIEVAWNQVRVHDFLQSPKDLERIYCEIHLLKTLKHRNIMKFYTSWVDTSNKQINFITEMFTSGTLRQYRLKHKRVSIRAVKHWCRQILEGLLYLHSHDPPVIHRDLKCDNIFINGNQGEVKIGDLGLAAILCNSHVAHCVGTPEFMAPEVYGQEYNELVDIYSFGMCILEMVTFEYPYSECTNPAHIYKKVTSGKRPDALYKVQDPEVRQFIEKCLATVPSRLSARELLDDPFLQTDDFDRDFRSIDCKGESDGIDPLIRQPFVDPRISDCSYRSWNCNSSEYEVEPYNEECHNYPVEVEASGVELVDHRDEIEHAPDMDITMKGTRREDGNIFLRLRIADKEGQFRNIYFPFDVEIDTALDVATEMVAELDITDQDVTYIAEMIDEEISKLVPEWKSGPEIEEEDLCAANTELCLNCDSSQTSFASCVKSFSSNPGHCSNGCPANAVEVEGDKLPTSTKQQIAALEQSEKWDCQESVDISSLGSGISHSDDDHKKSDKLTSPKHEIDGNQNEEQSYKPLSDDFENDFQWEMRWLKAKLQLELREIMDQQLRIPSKCSSRQKAGRDQQFSTSDQNSLAMSLRSDSVLTSSDFRSSAEITFPNSSLTANKSLCASSLLPGVLQRTTSLPVDAVHI